MSKTEAVTLSIRATNVTGTRDMPVDVPTNLPAEVVAKSVADLMSMPDNVPWALRDDASSKYLDDKLPIGDQLSPGASVTITPKTHLGKE